MTRLIWVVGTIIFAASLYGTHRPLPEKKCVNGMCMPADLHEAVKPAPEKKPEPDARL